ncbi:MAG: glucose/arabinose dehydrogenase, partial [Candidatus Omnitrophota bacterium]
MNPMKSTFSLCLILLSTLFTVPAAELELNKGDHITYVGNGLADRMQHDGWLETYIQIERADRELAFRNLGFAGDRFDRQPRHGGFPNPDDQLTTCEADVIFLFFGYNESFDDSPEVFGAELSEYIDNLGSKHYNGESDPRFVLVSPIAHEDLKDPNLPDPADNNARLEAYSDAIAMVAEEKDVPFVDLFATSQALYKKAKGPLTINGVHLNSEGNRQIAGVIFQSLFSKAAPSSAQVDRVREAVLDKNWHWFNRYRATDGNDVWGGRSGLRFNDQTNHQVLIHEVKMLDVMTANRDKGIWAAANGRKIEIDDSNVPAALPVKTNRKGKNPDGSHTFLGGVEAIEKMTLQEGLEANLFASEEMFPELVNPVQMAVDTRGRLWVAAWETYPKWEPLKEMKDTLLILPDENRDGKADKAIPFARVHNPTGFEFWNGGVLVASAPEIIFLKDTDGDDRADVRIVMMQGIDSADTHHTANGFVYGPDGGLFYQRGVFHVSNVETPWGPPSHSTRSGMYRFNPRTHEFGFHANNSPNPHGVSFDYWGYHYATDGTGGNAFQVVPNGGGGFTMRKLLNKKVRPVPANGILSSAQFPPESQGNFLICNSIGFLGLKQYTLAHEKGLATGTEVDDLLVSSDPNFRPTDVEVGADGALYISDWANPIVGHMQHNVRDPSRDHLHGRIYRVTAKGRPLQASVKVDGESIENLLENLKHPIDGVRYRTRIELSERDTGAVIAAAKKWVKKFDATKKEDAHHLLEALWLHQQHNVKDLELLEAVLNSPEENARIAAQTVRQYWTFEPAVGAPTKPVAGKSPDGASLMASHVGTSREEFDKAFDKNTASKWYVGDSPRIWVSYTYADGAARRVSAYAITSANDSSSRDPRDWQLYGSNDGKKWAVIDKRTN